MSDGYRAIAKNIDISAQKVRLVVDLVRGKPVVEALDMLKFVPNRSAKPVYKLVRSAMINAEENFGISRNNLVVDRIFADESRTLRRGRAGARGRYKPWLRRSSHITVVLKELAG
ncbi:MAG: 50S ribosomal protein L22 [Anaerolineae bacterium]|nr:MAG: 50S ribosomal protein L22 [Anaerolineae bacterium]